MRRQESRFTAFAALLAACFATLLTAGRLQAANAERYVPITPCRLLDTRSSGPAFSASFTQRDIAAWNVAPCGIPSTANVLTANVTAVVSAGGPYGYLQTYPTGGSAPPYTFLNFDSGNSAIGNSVYIPLGASGAFHLTYGGVGSGWVDVIIDVSGYFSETPAATSYAFQPLTECRVYDSRTLNDPLVTGPARKLTVAGKCGIPSGAAAASLSLTIPSASSDGFVQMFPSDFNTTPTASVNFKLSDLARTNSATTGFSLSRPDQLSLLVGAAANAHFILDTTGYFSASAPTVYYPISPCRIADTRDASRGIPRLVSGRAQDFQVQGVCGVPVGAAAAVLNVTSISNDGPGHLIAYPSGQPGTALNSSMMALPSARTTLASQSVQRLSSNPLDLTIHPYVVGGGTDLMIDVVGYFAAPSAGPQTRLPYLGAPVSLPGRVEAENYDKGGEGLAWHDTTAGNVFGVYRSDDMDVGAIPSGGNHIGAIADGEWAEYEVNIAPGDYELRVRYASAYAGSTKFRVFLDGVSIAGAQTITSTGDWQTYATKIVSVHVDPSGASPRNLHVAFDTGAWNFDWIEFAPITCVAPTVTNPVSLEPVFGTTATLSVTTTGTPAPTFQWFKNGSPQPLVDVPGAISGATTRELTLLNVEQGKDAGSYVVTVSNGCGSRTSNPATVHVHCGGSPDADLEDINRALRGGGEVCDWSEEINTGFPYNFGSGSYNRPVEAAATAFIREPKRYTTDGHLVWDMDKWWEDYLKGELGDRGTAWYYGGKEFGSYIYQHYNINAVMAVHYQAQITNKPVIRDLAHRWLRATFALHALAASPTPAITLHARGQSAIAKPVDYDGPYIAMAGERSSSGFWAKTARNILLGQALNHFSNRSGEQPEQKRVREWLEPRWSGPNGNLYGFTAAEQDELWNILLQAKIPPNFVSRFLGSGLRAYKRYDFLAWPLIRATVMEVNQNTNTVPTFGVVYFTNARLAGGHEAHFLYPWSGVFPTGDEPAERNGVNPPGWGRFDMANGFVEASNGAGSSWHPSVTVRIDGLPLSAPTYWLVLDPNQPPTFQ